MQETKLQFNLLQKLSDISEQVTGNSDASPLNPLTTPIHNILLTSRRINQPIVEINKRSEVSDNISMMGGFLAEWITG